MGERCDSRTPYLSPNGAPVRADPEYYLQLMTCMHIMSFSYDDRAVRRVWQLLPADSIGAEDMPFPVQHDVVLGHVHSVLSFWSLPSSLAMPTWWLGPIAH